MLHFLSKDFAQGFKNKFLKSVHSQGYSTLVRIKWQLSEIDYKIFIKVLLYKWGPRKRRGLDVVKFILFKGKNEIIIMILKECNINFSD